MTTFVCQPLLLVHVSETNGTFSAGDLCPTTLPLYLEAHLDPGPCINSGLDLLFFGAQPPFSLVGWLPCQILHFPARFQPLQLVHFHGLSLAQDCPSLHTTRHTCACGTYLRNPTFIWCNTDLFTPLQAYFIQNEKNRQTVTKTGQIIASCWDDSLSVKIHRWSHHIAGTSMC